jgi:hypothetical protein
MKRLIPLLSTILILSVLSSCNQPKTGGDEWGFLGTITEISESTTVVAPVEGEDILRSADKVMFSNSGLYEIDASVGDIVSVTYKGEIMESYPTQVNAVGWAILRKMVMKRLIRQSMNLLMLVYPCKQNLMSMRPTHKEFWSIGIITAMRL